jgi:PGF-CTERM protein
MVKKNVIIMAIFLLVVVLANGPGEGVVFAEEMKFDANETRVVPRESWQFLFNDEEYSFQCLRVLGLAATGAADLGEFVAAVYKVKEGDDESWYNAWYSMGEQVEGLARDFLKKGHKDSAQEAFFRAWNYYGVAGVFLVADYNDPRFQESWQKSRDCFLEGAKLSNGLIQPVEIPFENTTLPGYLCLVDEKTKKRPLLIIQTGLDGTAEELYFVLAVNALKRGYNCLLFEGPGQGRVIRVQKIPFRPDWETVVTPVVDFSLTLPQVDKDRIALAGYSMGGYMAPRAVAYDDRIKACIADGGVYSIFEGVMSLLSPELQKSIEEGQPAEKVEKLIEQEVDDNPPVKQFLAFMLWTFQADSYYDVFEKLKAYTLKDCVDQIQCDMLVVNSNQDKVAGSYEQAKKLYEVLKSPKTYLEFTEAEGAGEHCQMGAVMIMNEKILNWLDERMNPSAPLILPDGREVLPAGTTPTATPTTEHSISPRATAAPIPTPTATQTPTSSLIDSDGDGVADRYDYAPHDPNVQTKDDVKTPGFEAVFAIAGLLAVAYLLRRRG